MLFAGLAKIIWGGFKRHALRIFYPLRVLKMKTLCNPPRASHLN
jgi:hypothetical protein